MHDYALVRCRALPRTACGPRQLQNVLQRYALRQLRKPTTVKIKHACMVPMQAYIQRFKDTPLNSDDFKVRFMF